MLKHLKKTHPLIALTSALVCVTLLFGISAFVITQIGLSVQYQFRSQLMMLYGTNGAFDYAQNEALGDTFTNQFQSLSTIFQVWSLIAVFTAGALGAWLSRKNQLAVSVLLGVLFAVGLTSYNLILNQRETDHQVSFVQSQGVSESTLSEYRAERSLKQQKQLTQLPLLLVKYGLSSVIGGLIVLQMTKRRVTKEF